MADRAVVGWPAVLLVAVAVVGVARLAPQFDVFHFHFGTSLLPSDVQQLVFRTPLLIGVLVIGTAVVLIRLVRRPPDP